MSFLGTRVEDCELPKAWSIGRLDEVCYQMKQGKILPRKEIHETGSYPVFGANGCIGYSEEYFLEKQRVLITCRGSTCGVVNKSPAKSFVTNNAMILFEKDFLENDFLFFVLQEFSTERLKTGSGQPQLTKGILNSHAIPLPPLPEQKKIAHVLSTVQRAIEAQERIIQTTTELKKALMNKLFTEGLRNEPHKQTEVGPIPESWEVVPLRDLIDISHGYAFKSKFFTTDGPTVLTPGNFKLDGGLYWGKRTKFTTEVYDDSVVLDPGDLVVVMTDLTPTAKLLGGPAFIPEGRTVLHNQRIGKIFLTNPNTTPKFLYWVFLSDAFKRYMRMTATGSTVRHTSPTKIKDYTFGLPSPNEQEELIEILERTDSKISVAGQKSLALKDLFRTLLHELMTAKVRVHENSN